MRTTQRHIHFRRGFNLVELLMALAITASLLTAVLVALNASFTAYQTTTEVASTHTISRLTMHRLLAMIRTGHEFGPFPLDPLDPIVRGDEMQFLDPNGILVELRYAPGDEALYVRVNEGEWHLLLEGVVAQAGVSPFTLEYEKGRHLYRATIDMAIKPDDNMSVSLDGNNTDIIRLVASAMPREAAY